jgi:hypothetical protein
MRSNPENQLLGTQECEYGMNLDGQEGGIEKREKEIGQRKEER